MAPDGLSWLWYLAASLLIVVVFVVVPPGYPRRRLTLVAAAFVVGGGLGLLVGNLAAFTVLVALCATLAVALGEQPS